MQIAIPIFIACPNSSCCGDHLLIPGNARRPRIRNPISTTIFRKRCLPIRGVPFPISHQIIACTNAIPGICIGSWRTIYRGVCSCGSGGRNFYRVWPITYVSIQICLSKFVALNKGESEWLVQIHVLPSPQQFAFPPSSKFHCRF